MAEPAEAGDDLVEHQQDFVLVADRAQPLQIALRRRQHRGRARHRLDEHRGDGVVAVQRDQPFQFVGQMRAPFRLAPRERLLLAVIGVRQMIDAGQHGAERLAVVAEPADRHAAEADAVIAALAPDEALRAAPARAHSNRRARSSSRCRPLPTRNCRRTRDRDRPAPAPRSGSPVRTISGWRIGTAARNPSPRPAPGSRRRSARDYARHWCTTGPRRRRGSACPPA